MKPNWTSRSVLRLTCRPARAPLFPSLVLLPSLPPPSSRLRRRPHRHRRLRCRRHPFSLPQEFPVSLSLPHRRSPFLRNSLYPSPFPIAAFLFSRRRDETFSLPRRPKYSLLHRIRVSSIALPSQIESSFDFRESNPDNWSVKAIRRKTTGTGCLRYLRHVPRRFKTNFREDVIQAKHYYFAKN